MPVDRTMHEHHRPDLVLMPAYERIADLRAAARSARSARPVSTSRGIVAAVRDAIGRRLIAAGSSLVVDESLRRRPAVRP